MEAYGKHRQKQEEDQKLQQGLTFAEQIYSNPDLSPEQKQIGLFKALRNNPEMAKVLGAQLSGMQGRQQKPMSKYDQAMNDENSFLERLLGGGGTQQSNNEYAANDFGSPQEEDSRQGQSHFDYKDASKWSDKQINQLRSIQGNSTKAKTLSKMAQNEFQSRQDSKKAKSDYQKNIAPLESALDSISAMEDIGSRGNLGVGTTLRGMISPKARRDAAEYSRLGKSLIQFSSNIPIRNRAEFETLAHDLYDPSISDASREGILNAMKQIIQSSMNKYEAPEEGTNMPTESKAGRSLNQNRPPLNSFLR